MRSEDGSRMAQSLGGAFDVRHNSLNAMRLVLAALVIVSHSWPIGGYGDDPVLGDQNLGGWAVAGFFCISGFLITRSREQSQSFSEYLIRRTLRIYPGFLVSLVVVAFFIAPVALWVSRGGDWTFAAAAAFVYKNLFLFVAEYGIDGTLSSAPYPDVWNGALWTLFWEFVCYLGVGILFTVVVRRRVAAVTTVLILCAGVSVLPVSPIVDLPETLAVLARFGGFFAAGALIYLLREQIPVNLGFTLIAAVLVAVLSAVGLSSAFVGLPFAYLLLVAAIVLPLQRIGAKNDISYGMYIYGFPLQQVLALLLPRESVPLILFAAASVLVAVPFAAASWFIVERPMLRRGRGSAVISSRFRRVSTAPPTARHHSAVPQLPSSRGSSGGLLGDGLPISGGGN